MGRKRCGRLLTSSRMWRCSTWSCLAGAASIEVTWEARPRGLATRLLMLSAYDQVCLVRAALEAGASGYLLKLDRPEAIITQSGLSTLVRWYLMKR
jgi:hypothetical protein